MITEKWIAENKLVTILFGLFVAVNILDVSTTLYAINILHHVELNPLSNYFIQTFHNAVLGQAVSLIALKIMLILGELGLVYFCTADSSERKYFRNINKHFTAFLLVCVSTLIIIVVLSNTMIIMFGKGVLGL